MGEKMSKNVTFDKSEDFALRIIKLYEFLIARKKEYTISKQILRSGASVGANLAEAVYGVSDNDFVHKNTISRKECAETLYWLRLLEKSKLITKTQFGSIYSDGCEIMKMLTSTIKTMQIKIKRDETKKQKKISNS